MFALLLLLHSMRFRVRRADLDPPRISFRRCRRSCKQVPCTSTPQVWLASLAGKSGWQATLWAFFVLSTSCLVIDTLLQFSTECTGKFVILRRHEHGRPVSRSEGDLQGPNLGRRVPRQRILGANLHLPSVPPGIAISSKRMPHTEI